MGGAVGKATDVGFSVEVGPLLVIKGMVARAVGGVCEVVAHERTGFVGESDDELAYGLAQLLDSERMRAEMGRRARLRIQKRHSAGHLAGRLLSVYEGVLEEATCVS